MPFILGFNIGKPYTYSESIIVWIKLLIYGLLSDWNWEIIIGAVCDLTYHVVGS